MALNAFWTSAKCVEFTSSARCIAFLLAASLPSAFRFTMANSGPWYLIRQWLLSVSNNWQIQHQWQWPSMIMNNNDIQSMTMFNPMWKTEHTDWLNMTMARKQVQIKTEKACFAGPKMIQHQLNYDQCPVACRILSKQAVQLPGHDASRIEELALTLRCQPCFRVIPLGWTTGTQGHQSLATWPAQSSSENASG